VLAKRKKEELGSYLNESQPLTETTGKQSISETRVILLIVIK